MVMGFTEEDISSSEDFNVYRIYQCCCSKQCSKKEIRNKSNILCTSCPAKQNKESYTKFGEEEVLLNEASPNECDSVEEHLKKKLVNDI